MREEKKVSASLVPVSRETSGIVSTQEPNERRGSVYLKRINWNEIRRLLVSRSLNAYSPHKHVDHKRRLRATPSPRTIRVESEGVAAGGERDDCQLASPALDKADTNSHPRDRWYQRGSRNFQPPSRVFREPAAQLCIFTSPGASLSSGQKNYERRRLIY